MKQRFEKRRRVRVARKEWIELRRMQSRHDAKWVPRIAVIFLGWRVVAVQPKKEGTNEVQV